MTSVADTEDYREFTRKKKDILPDRKADIEAWLKRRKDREDQLKRTRERLNKWTKE